MQKVDFNRYKQAYYKLDFPTIQSQNPEYIDASISDKSKLDFFVWGEGEACVVVRKSRAYKFFYVADVVYGPVLDMDNTELFARVLSDLDEYYKEELTCIGIRISPEYPTKIFEGIENPEEIQSGLDNDKVLKNKGFKRAETRWFEDPAFQIDAIYIKDIEGMSYDDWLKSLPSKVRSQIRRVLKDGVKVRPATSADLPAMREMQEDTSEETRNAYVNLERYLNWAEKTEDVVLFPLAYLDCAEGIKNLDAEDEASRKQQAKLDKKYSGREESSKYVNQTREIEAALERNTVKRAELNELRSKYGNEIDLAYSIYVTGNKRLVHLKSSPSPSPELRSYNSTMAIHNAMFKYACDHEFVYYDFFGAMRYEDNPTEKDLAVLRFKDNFDGNFVYLSGNWYKPYNFLFNKFK